MNKPDIGKFIDLTHYPLDRSHSEDYQSLVSSKKTELNAKQFCTMPGFLLDEQRRKIVASIEIRQRHTHRADSERNVYLERTRTPSLPVNHPKNIFARGCYNMMGTHLLDPYSPLKDLYYWPPMQQFIADIVGEPQLYPNEDPCQPVNVLCHGNGDRSAWHFDSYNAFTMTMMLQAPESGGEFQMVPNIRSATNPNVDELSQLLQGEESKVVNITRDEGELIIFRGCHSAHRVTPVKGNRLRLMCVMVYETKPGVMGDPVVNETVYGVKK